MLKSFRAVMALAIVECASAYLSDDGQVVIPGAQSYNGLNLLPQMGWDNWNAFGCKVSEDLVLSTARAMMNSGLRDLGYNYVVLDDCWSVGRNETGYLVHNKDRFPNGMRYVADQLHAMGMKWGMYSSAGTLTCAKYPGSLGYEEKDAMYFAENGVDYLKYDNCDNNGQSGTPQISFNRYNVMSKALNATGRPIVYALCNWGNDQTYDWAYSIANSGRMSGDIYDSFNRPDDRCACTETPCTWPGYHCSVMNILSKMAPIVSRTRPGYFNDMDMLEVGNGGQSDSEYIVHFSMWALLSSPLLIGTDITKLTPANYAIYANPAVIALNQDPTGTAAVRVWKKSCDDVDDNGQCETQLWQRELDNGDFAVAMINGANSSMQMTIKLSEIFLDKSTSGTLTPFEGLSESWDVHDLWANRMNNMEAATILNSTSMMSVETNSTTRYNATYMSYEDGLKGNNSALMGKLVGTISPHGSWTTTVDRHSVGLFRLRQRQSMSKDEL